MGETGKRRWMTPEWVVAIFTVVLAGTSCFQWRELNSSGADTKRLLKIYEDQARALNDIATATQSESATLQIQTRALQDQAQAGLRSATVAEDSAEPKPELITADLPHGFGLKIRNSGGSPAEVAATSSIIGNNVEISFEHTGDIPAKQANETATRVFVKMKEEGKAQSWLDEHDNWEIVRASLQRVIGTGRKNVCTTYENEKHLWYRVTETLSFSKNELLIGSPRVHRIGKGDRSCPQD
jgi:hypothetical protein